MLKHMTLLAAVAVVAIAMAGCGGGDSKGDDAQAVFDVFFPPEHADALAHAAIPEPADMPGPGWEVSARDEFDDGDAAGDGSGAGADGELGSDEFEEAFKNEPACAGLNALGDLGGLFGESGDGEEEPPAGRAQIELSNGLSGRGMPTSVEVEVEIAQTVAEVEGSWELVRDMLQSDEIEQCMLAAFDTVFAASDELEGAEITVKPREATNDAPNGGAVIAFDMHIKAAGIEVDLVFEGYLWPHGNASVSVFVMGNDVNIDRQLTEGVLDAVDTKVTNVGKMASAE